MSCNPLSTTIFSNAIYSKSKTFNIFMSFKPMLFNMQEYCKGLDDKVEAKRMLLS